MNDCEIKGKWYLIALDIVENIIKKKKKKYFRSFSLFFTARVKMITPKFELAQTEDFLILDIKVPYIKVNEILNSLLIIFNRKMRKIYF
jgi:hypothetical protein